LPSIGTTNGERAQKAAGLTNGATVIVPCKVAASSDRANSRAAAIEVYSVPWTPAMTVRCGPGRSPLTVTY
jgi:hypothetical protein